MDYATTITTDLPYTAAVEAVKQALADEGFGTLTEIDVKATLDTKIGVEIEDYIILGACNPRLAHRALEVERDIGLLLPCNVVVRAAGGSTIVQALNPQVMVNLPEREELQPIADEASRRIAAALKALPQHTA